MQHTVRTQRQYAGPSQPQESAQLMLGRYRVLSTNSSGGFGDVSICWDTRLQRRVAIKRMPLRMSSEYPSQASTIDEALAEARTSSLLAHPNIVRVYDFESDDTSSYLVMEYVDGLNLAELLSRVEGGVLTFDECAHLVDSLASALAYAHENRVLHLDIKPANIMIDRQGIVKLGDFGMASLASAAGYAGARGGTVGYMPPEQIEGDYVDERTDSFSLAVVTWQALMGSCPYAAKTPEESLKLIRRGPSPTLSRVEPELAGVVEQTLLRALDPSPQGRMSSIREFARDLVDALGDTMEGVESFRDLLNQAEENDNNLSQDGRRGSNLPLLVRLPWLGGLCTRLLAAVTAGWAAHLAIVHLMPDSRAALLFGTFGVAAASAAWPPLGGALGIAAFVASLFYPPSVLSLPLALVFGTCGFMWWLAVGRNSYLSGPALLLPSCLGSPLAGVGLSGFALEPLSAFCTGMGGWFLQLSFNLAIQNGFFAESIAKGLQQAAMSPSTWVLSIGCGLAALVCSLLARRRTVAGGIAGQVVALAILASSYAALAYMENDSIATALGKPALGIALSLGATLCVATILTGGGVQDQEGDDRP